MPNSAKEILFQLLKSEKKTKIIILLFSLMSAFFGILAPLSQKYFVDSLSGLDTNYIYLLLATLSLFLYLTFNVLANYFAAKDAYRLQNEISKSYYKKILDLRPDTLGKKTAGELVSIYATDIPGATILIEQNFPQAAMIIFPLILAPVALVYFYDIPVFWTLVLLACVALINLTMAYRQSKFFYKFKALAADRIGLVNEWIINLRLLRTLGWMNHYEKKIFESRKIETFNRVKMVTNGQSMNAINSSLTFFLNILAIQFVISSSNIYFNKSHLLSLLWIVGIFLTKPFRQMPWLFMFLFDSWTSIKRISDVLDLDNQDHRFKTAINDKKVTLLPSASDIENAIEVENLNLKINHQHVLKNLNFSIKDKEFVTIVGEVGSGKSLLLLSLIGETNAEFSKYNIFGKNAFDKSLEEHHLNFSFVSQEGFIMNSTLRENVAFEYQTSEQIDVDLKKSLLASEFETQLDNERSYSLDTEIGERGINLSGGQNQRVNLARAFQYNRPIVCIDDGLSALDVNTENKIINNLFYNQWKDKTIILATHRLTVLEKSDRVLFIENGQIVAFDSYNKLKEGNERFKIFIESLTKKESSHEPI